ncbi:DMT family transporter [Clostridium saccharoperbutylacetonicum]|uniref:DMT family transporter n=1 Tax=Clostridium saccharoperbutylacetonicum TaxID=36745 RepID=UPI000983F45F|nr:DMT family transporter [Clostridium saccharoperbutylacetonicum]AQR94799.1 EamA-like transporter family protein [Clostridium saccharoperbutylacetonicum]NSB30640.1 drug/metabolite transporter (DMT)-like permease [Clostridium saccharoperbutylacetonicum]
MEKYRKKAILYLITASILWSIGGLFIKLVNWNPMAIAGARSGIAAIVMFLYLKKPIIHLGKTKLLGACTYSSLLIFFVTANKLTTSANAILLQFTAPIWVVLFLKIFLKEKIKKSDLAVIVFVMLGMTLFFIGDLGQGTIVGNFIAILSGISMAGVVIFLKLIKDGSPVEMTFLGNIITFIIAIPFFFQSVPSLNSILGILILGIFQLGVSYIFYTLAVKYVSPIEAILIPVLEPLLNPFWVFLFTGEIPGTYAFIGGLIVLTAISVRELCIKK